ncbi:MAG: SRPBCC domain-containing protein [Firmicutes bacterium]|nr:SRPBCC domain-containing protein [Bacillota bacterium]
MITTSTSFCREIRIHAPRERVWKALTDPEELNRWETQSAAIDLRIGGRIELDYGGIKDLGTIVELDPPARLAYQDEAGLRTTWTLEDEGGSTLVRLEMSGFGLGDFSQLQREGASFSMGLLMQNLRSVVEEGRDLRPNFWRVRLGVTYVSLRTDHGDRGVPDGALVLQVAQGSPAHEAGLRAGDIVRRANGKPVRTYADLAQVLHETGPGEPVALDVFREGSMMRLVAVAAPSSVA